MRKQNAILTIILLAITMFCLGFYDKYVTAFITIEMKYGFSLFIMTLLYAYLIYVLKELEWANISKLSKDDEILKLSDENWKLHNTIVKIKTESKPKTNRAKK